MKHILSQFSVHLFRSTILLVLLVPGYSYTASDNPAPTPISVSPEGSIDTERVDFAQLYDQVYQIQVIESETQNKSSLGSGFQVTDDGLVITNYHVIADLVFEPDRHKLRYVDYGGQEGDLDLIDFDVIHDLALLRLVGSVKENQRLNLATSLPKLGESIYSLGNPHDVGMLMVTGGYNGLAEYSYNDEILFSGSLNPGMSGGPTVNLRGEVVGVNVSTAGSQLSFLVPVAKVRQLLDGAIQPLSKENYLEVVTRQIKAFQARYFEALFKGEVPQEELGDRVFVAGEVGLDTNCWGGSNEDQDDANYSQLSLTCNNSNHIYLSRGFNTGLLHYSYLYNETDELSRHRFHALISDASYSPDNRVDTDEVTRYECEQSYLQAEETERYVQTGFCVRAYLQLKGLYDVLFYEMSAGNKNALTIHYTLAGVTRDIAEEFTQWFMRSATWK